MANIQHPWQRGPTELVMYALEHLHREEDADRRIAFLLLDVGVETMFKTFLLLPEKVTATKMPHADRKKAAEASFREVCDGLERAAGTRMQGIDLEHVNFFHTRRNQLYHDGNGITIPSDLVREYASLAVDMLRRLLDVDLADELRKPEIEALRAAEEKAKQEREKREIDEQTERIREARDNLARSAASAIEQIYPKLLLPSFMGCFEKLRDEAFRGSAAVQTSPNLEQAREALAEIAVPQEIRNIRMFNDLAELYLGVLEWIYRPLVSSNPSPNAVWFYSYRSAADYPLDFMAPSAWYDEEGNLDSSVTPSHEEVLAEGRQRVKTLDDIRQVIDECSKQGAVIQQLIQAEKAKTQAPRPDRNRGAYGALRDWLQTRAVDQDTLEVEFKDIEKILDHPLPASAYQHREWWANHSKNASGAAWLNAGWRVTDVDLTAHQVVLERMNAALYQQFFTDLLARLKVARPGVTNANKPQPASGFYFSAGRSWYFIGWSFGRGGVLRVELLIDMPETAENKRAFDKLETQKDGIEQEIGAKLSWDRMDENRQSKIRATQKCKITDPPAELEEAKVWALETTLKFVGAFQPRIKDL